MPIDFNPYVLNFMKPPIVKQQHYQDFKYVEDTFIKNIDTNFDGIKIEAKSFGKIKKTGEEALLYTITNKNGASIDLSTFGATITGIKIPDKNGKLIDVTHGYNNVTPYEESPIGHAGGTMGPYANKISDGKFKINNQEYSLDCNKDNGKSHSHGGKEGIDIQNWKAKKLRDGVEFTYLKKEDNSNYPGNVKLSVIYKFDNNNNLHIKYKATTDRDTIVNMTNHTYFNLDGSENNQENSVLDHIVTLPNSSSITENNQIGIPNGKIIKVKDSPFDFSTPKKISDVINLEHEQLKIGKGFDQNYCVDNYDGKSIIEIAKVKSNKSGITLKVSTNLPGFQFYTANNLGKSTQPKNKFGSIYQKRSGLCIEPQFYPNAINTESFSEKGVLKVGEEYNREIIYSFTTD